MDHSKDRASPFRGTMKPWSSLAHKTEEFLAYENTPELFANGNIYSIA